MSESPESLFVADLESDDTDRQTRAFDHVYQELRVIARRYMGGERPNHTLQPTELVNEACLKLIPSVELDELTRGRLIGFGARAMRQVLTDHAREANAAKRGAGWGRVTLRAISEAQAEHHVSLVTLDEALTWLEQQDAHLGEMTELHYFGGMTGDELAARYDVSRSKITRELALARARLLSRIDEIEADRPTP